MNNPDNTKSNHPTAGHARMMLFVMLLGSIAAGGCAGVLFAREGVSGLAILWAIACLGQLAGAIGGWLDLRKTSRG